MIRKGPKGWHVVSESGKNLGGPYPSKEAARKRLAQVEMFKSMDAAGTKRKPKGKKP